MISQHISRWNLLQHLIYGRNHKQAVWYEYKIVTWIFHKDTTRTTKFLVYHQSSKNIITFMCQCLTVQLHRKWIGFHNKMQTGVILQSTNIDWTCVMKYWLCHKNVPSAYSYPHHPSVIMWPRYLKQQSTLIKVPFNYSWSTWIDFELVRFKVQ